MGRINRANIRKTLYYLKRNGITNTFYAARERLEEGKKEPYRYQSPPEQELAAQRKKAAGGLEFQGTISIVVPAYCTAETYLRELLNSVLCQTYSNWELILADASEDDSVQRVAESFPDERIRYVRLEGNFGIAENTNRAIRYATGEFIGLLDHDDLLTADALYEMAVGIGAGGKILYSDEDKCNAEGTEYFEPNFKEKFNLDLLLSNNYICHFLVMESSILKELGFRSKFDGAQDYDLILRAVEKFLDSESGIVHIPKVLYHWRCHSASTAENPRSKQYAYEAGRRAVQDFVNRQGWSARVISLRHLGFYQLSYPAGPLLDRTDLGAVGGRILLGNKVAGGRMTEEGGVYYEGLPAAYSGYLHRAAVSQDAEAVDIRCIRVRQECIPIFEKITGVTYREIQGTAVFDSSTLPEGTDYAGISVALGKAIREAGYRVLYQPSMTITLAEEI